MARRTRAEIREAIDRLERDSTNYLRNYDKVRRLKRVLEAIDAEEERERAEAAKRMAKMRENRKNFNKAYMIW